MDDSIWKKQFSFSVKTICITLGLLGAVILIQGCTIMSVSHRASLLEERVLFLQREVEKNEATMIYDAAGSLIRIFTPQREK